MPDISIDRADTIELLPCPFCGDKMESVVRTPDGFASGPGLLYVTCDCGAQGAGGKTVPEAIAAWNLSTSPAPAAPTGWRPIAEAPKDGRTLLLGYFNSHGKWRTLRGQWFSEAHINDNWEEECEEGWYETSVECGDDVNCWKTEPTHFMFLPAAPGATSQGVAVAQPDAREAALEQAANLVECEYAADATQGRRLAQIAQHIRDLKKRKPV